MGAPFGFMAFLGVVSLVGVIVSHIIVLFAPKSLPWRCRRLVPVAVAEVSDLPGSVKLAAVIEA